MRAAPRPAVPEDGGAVPLTRSLAFRSSAALGLALALAALALVLLFGPYLQEQFRIESGELLRDQAHRRRSAARSEADATAELVGSAVQRTLDAAGATFEDLPLELVTSDAARVRELAAQRVGTLRAEGERRTDVLRDELRRRTEERLREDEQLVDARNAARARTFGSSVAMRAAALLLALVAALFLLHGVLLYRGVLSPVRRLGEAVRAVAAGRLGTRIPVTGDDEVARLAGSFNAMTQSLEAAHDELESLNAGMEERVGQQTTELRAALAESREANRRLEKALAELRERERELRHAEKMASLGALAGGVAHEFGNLLGGIQGCAEDAAHETDAAELRDTLAMIERTARRGTAITGNLLRFARPGTGEVADLDAAHLLRDVADLIAPEAARTGVDVHVATAGDTAFRGDASGMHQVLLNLATNALHAMRERGGTLTLGARAVDGDVVLTVADTGHGIPADVRERLFEPFFTTRGPAGTGLGLAVTYGIVRAHGGTIEIESEAGRGATFRVVLPRSPQAADGRPRQGGGS